ncbi:MAG: YceI family protein [Xanthomonadales bacterium]|nr:Protein YceI [Xanthomonadales bacterium]MCC6592344.1 YceI family protein [Xanthomonadales bacterium]
MRAPTCLAALVLAGTAGAEPMTYAIDQVHSQVHASVLHMGMSNSTARFEIKDGSITADSADWNAAKVAATLDIAGISLGDDTWQEHVSASKWFDVASFPEARFVSTRVERTGDQMLAIHGDLTLKGTTKPVVLQARINHAGPHPMSKQPALGISASGSLKRSEFGISEYLGSISDEVQLRIEIEAKAG